MKAYSGVEVKLHTFLTFVLDGIEWIPSPGWVDPITSFVGRNFG
jgi:hypothetical protein